MLLTHWSNGLVSRSATRLLRSKATRRRTRRRSSAIASVAEVLEDRVMLSAQVIGGDEPPEGNPSQGNVDPGSIEHHLLPTDQATDTVTLTLASGEQVTAADIVFIVDESGSMAGEHAWIGGMVQTLDTSLAAQGITNNQYAMLGYLAEGTLFGTTPKNVRVSFYGPDNQLVKTAVVPFESTTGAVFADFELPSAGDYLVVIERETRAYASIFALWMIWSK